MLAGGAAAWMQLNFPFHGMLVAVLPPGAFFGIAALIALRNWLGRERPAPVAAPVAEIAAAPAQQ